MRTGTRRMLVERFPPHNEWVAQMTRRSLDHWNGRIGASVTEPPAVPTPRPKNGHSATGCCFSYEQGSDQGF